MICDCKLIFEVLSVASGGFVVSDSSKDVGPI